MTTLKEIADELLRHAEILIFCHTRPDGDTIGSAMAVKTALSRKNIASEIVCSSDIPNKYFFLKGVETIKKPTEITKEYSVHLSVDVSVESMLGDAYGLYTEAKTLINVDHHISNSRYAKYNYVKDMAACSEIIYELINELGVEIDAEIADFLLLGLSTDTGNFMHSNVTGNTLSVASDLVSRGGNLHEIAYKMFKSQSKSRANLYAKIISRTRYFLDDKLAIITIFKSDLEEFGATSDMTEGFIDFPLSVDGVEVAVSVLETKPEHSYKISFRSKGKINVNEVASVFGGGGHILASGCMIFGFYEDVKDKIIRAVSDTLE